MNPVPVSVIIPCFNCANSIERAVRSVASQSRRPKQVIAIDDASTDDTLSKLMGLRSCCGGDWIKVLRQGRNQGAGTARNAGWEEAEEPYIAFLDADDAWHERKIEIQYEWMTDHPQAIFSAHSTLRLDENQTYPPLPRIGMARLISPVTLLFSNRFPTPSVMLRRDIPFRFMHGKRYSEDYLLWLQIGLKGHPLYHLDIPLAYLFKSRFGEGGLTGDLWRMERGELENYWRLAREGLVSPALLICATTFSLAKFIRRLMRSYPRFVQPSS